MNGKRTSKHKWFSTPKLSRPSKGTDWGGGGTKVLAVSAKRLRVGKEVKHVAVSGM